MPHDLTYSWKAASSYGAINCTENSLDDTLSYSPLYIVQHTFHFEIVRLKPFVWHAICLHLHADSMIFYVCIYKIDKTSHIWFDNKIVKQNWNHERKTWVIFCIWIKKKKKNSFDSRIDWIFSFISKFFQIVKNKYCCKNCDNRGGKKKNDNVTYIYRTGWKFRVEKVGTKKVGPGSGGPKFSWTLD